MSSSLREKLLNGTTKFFENLSDDERRKISKTIAEDQEPWNKLADKRTLGNWKTGQNVMQPIYAFNISLLFEKTIQGILLGQSSEICPEFNRELYISVADYDSQILKVVEYMHNVYYARNTREMVNNLGVSNVCVRNWLKKDGISTENLCKIAKILEVPIDYLFYKDFEKYLCPLEKNKKIIRFPESIHILANCNWIKLTGSIITKEDNPKLTCCYTSPITKKKLNISEEGTYFRDPATNNFILSFKSRKDGEKLVIKFEIFGDFKNQYNLIGGIGQLQIDTIEVAISKDPQHCRETQVFVYSILRNELQTVFKYLDEEGKKLEFSANMDKLVYHMISQKAAESIKEAFGTDICHGDIDNISKYLHIPPDRCEKLIRKFLKENYTA